MPSSLLSANPRLLPSNLSPRIHQSNSIRRTNQNPFQIPKGLLSVSVSDGNPCSNCRIWTSRFTRFGLTRGEKSFDVDVKTNRESEMEIGDDGGESRLKVEVGVPNFPVYLRWSKMSLGDQAFFLLAFVACTTSLAFTCLVVAAVPTLYAMRRAAISLSKLADTAREELPSTMAAIRLSGMEISDLTLELSDLSQEIADGVNKSVRAVQAAEAGIQQLGILAQRQTISMIQERASLPIISLQPVVSGAAKKTSRAIGQATKAFMNIISRVKNLLNKRALKDARPPKNILFMITVVCAAQIMWHIGPAILPSELQLGSVFKPSSFIPNCLMIDHPVLALDMCSPAQQTVENPTSLSQSIREFTQFLLKMTTPNIGPLQSDSTNHRPCFFHFIPAAALFFIVFLIWNTFITTDYNQITSSWRISIPVQDTSSGRCKDQCRPYGSEALPKGIVITASDLEMQPLWGSRKEKKKAKESKSLLALAVGIKQKEIVDKIVRKFPSCDFTVMLFHYDAVVDEWRDLPWSASVLHVSAMNQTKWWFSKRFLHPDIVAEYEYIFIWDEDLGVENFHPGRYLSIVKEEGLEISQPALDPTNLPVHHGITVRGKGLVHRRMFKPGKCFANSTEPPCTGWVEMMAPVFSRAAWRCAWYMIQNDLIHAWGLDKKLGYCAQGDRTKNVGVVDSEYIVHHGLPTLGGSDERKGSDDASGRAAVRLQSAREMGIFEKRWQAAVEEHDDCWTDPYPHSRSRSR
ncbi:hypothetical protein AAC387_Pa08g2481 [Persea americana]